MTTIVTEGGGDQAGGGGDQAAFAAGVAAATAAGAAEDADAALERAEAAEAVAEAAVSIAADASGDAWDAKFEIDRLRSDMDAGFAQVVERIDGLSGAGAGAAGEGTDDTVPAPEARQTAAEPAGEADSAATSKSGSKKHWWFGDRG